LIFVQITVTRYRQELGLKAVLAVKQVNDALEKHPHPEIFNTDQGAQCTSEIHTQHLKKLGMTISMDGKGRATDNSCIERF
jgi:putative transposase